MHLLTFLKQNYIYERIFFPLCDITFFVDSVALLSDRVALGASAPPHPTPPCPSGRKPAQSRAAPSVAEKFAIKVTDPALPARSTGPAYGPSDERSSPVRLRVAIRPASSKASRPPHCAALHTSFTFAWTQTAQTDSAGGRHPLARFVGEAARR